MTLTIIEKERIDALLKEEEGDNQGESSLDSRSLRRMIRRLGEELDYSRDILCNSEIKEIVNANRIQTMPKEVIQSTFSFTQEFTEYNAVQDEKERKQRLIKRKIAIQKLRLDSKIKIKEQSDCSNCIFPLCGASNKLFKANCIIL